MIKFHVKNFLKTTPYHLMLIVHIRFRKLMFIADINYEILQQKFPYGTL